MTGFVQSLITIVLFVLILGVLVVIHELGHFVTARLAGVRVLEFGIGFPPRAKVLRRRGETLYTLNWVPLGGFVKLEGEDGNDASDPRSFASQRLPTKLLILLAGVGMNLVLSVAIFIGIAWLATPYVGVRFHTVQEASPAARAGLMGGDAIVAVNGKKFELFGNDSILDELRGMAGQTVVLTVDHANGSQQDVPVALRPPSEVNEKQGPLGISASQDAPFEAYFFGETTGHDLPTAVSIGTRETGRALGLILGGLGALVSSFAANPTGAPPVAGPIGIAVQIGDVFWNAGAIMTLYVAGILSANLALVNILPFPPLDGGRMLVITLKSIFGQRISLQAERLTYVVGFIFLFAFIIWVTGFDIARLFGARS